MIYSTVRCIHAPIVCTVLDLTIGRSKIHSSVVVGVKAQLFIYI